MSLLNNQASLGTSITNALTGGSSPIDNALGRQSYTPQDFQRDGFIVPPIPNADGNGLPSSKVSSQRRGHSKRNMVHWFVPEVGVINMYINPQSIAYNYKKLINSERTKGGYVVQYWGEEFATLNIRGNTGSSGINGLNVLYEIYRAEQYMFDSIALTMAADNSVAGLSDLIDSALGNIGGLSGSVASATGGLLGISPSGQSILPRSTPSLAAMALGVEMYWSGWVHRGYFTSFSFTESAERIGLFEYDIGFTVTQRRGYRINNQGWQHSAIDGPSDWKTNPLSISGTDTSSNHTSSAPGLSGKNPFAK